MQTLFTELKKIALVLRYDSSKLATTRKKCPKMAQNRPKTWKIAFFQNFKILFLFATLAISLAIWHITRPQGYEQNLFFRFLIFLRFWVFLGHFWLFSAILR